MSVRSQPTSTSGLLQTGSSLLAILLLSGCAANIPDKNLPGRHIEATSMSASPAQNNQIPDIVTATPLLTPPQPEAETELLTFSGIDIPVQDLFYILGRDSGINIDVSPNLTGTISINVIDQSLPQILQRIARQTDIRWYFDEADNLVVEPDAPFWKNYIIDYVNLSRNAQTQLSISTAITAGGAGGGGGQNNSSSTMTQTVNNEFWATLRANLAGLLGESATNTESSAIISNPESGLVSVRATQRQHAEIADFINNVLTRSLHQVLIEATVVEVSLNDDYQSGVDWSLIDRNNGEINFVQNVTNSALQNISNATNILTIDRTATPDAITATIAMLSQFGELEVWSSPKIMALNNQSAMLRVVENLIYFNVDVEPGTINNGVQTPATITTTPNTVPVGFVMTVTPQISGTDQITLNVRPTISRIKRYVQDPNPALGDAGVENPVPEIQVQELDSILKLYDGQIAILGGLMQDSIASDTSGLPGVSRLPFLRNVFGYRSERASKTELIIFIRPAIIRQPSLDGDLKEYRDYLPTNGLESSATIQPGQLPINRAR